MKGNHNMKNRNNKVTALLFVVSLALAPMVQAEREPQGGPSGIRTVPVARSHPAAVARRDRTPVNDGAGENSEMRGGFSADLNLPVVTIHSTDSVSRGETGTFVLHMKPAPMFGRTYVNFALSGTAVQGVDYVVPASPAYISPSGYGVIQIKTLPDLRGSAFNQAYSVVITLKPGAGYTVGGSSSAIMWIKP